MEKIFTCTLIVNSKEIEYDVVFSDESYTFTTKDETVIPKKFALIRTQDEWKSVEKSHDDVIKQGTKALEKYLLSQH